MHNKRSIAKGLVFTTALVNVPIDSLANTIEEYKIENIGKDREDSKIGGGIKKFFAKIVEPIEELTTEPKEVIKVNKNIVRGSVLEITLSDGQFIEDLSGNPNGYETIRVTTVGSKNLVKEDYDNLRLSGIPKVDLSKASSRIITKGAFSNATHLTEFKFPKNLQQIESSSDYTLGAFYNCVNLKGDLILPSTLTDIGFNAFRGCSGFNGRLMLPSSINSIGAYAFYGCSGFIGDLTISDSLSTMGTYAFGGCSGFNGSLKLSNSLKKIENGVFTGCSNLTGELKIPNSVTYVGNSAFDGCSGFFGDLIIHDNVSIVGAGAFSGCSGFNGALYISSNITSIPLNTFSNCINLSGTLLIPNSVIDIGNSAFKNCISLTGNLIIPSSVLDIKPSAFYNCTGFSGILKIPNGVTSVGSSAFQGCSNFVGDLIIPDSVSFLGTSAFNGCSGFNGELYISKSITEIYDSTFNGCSGLKGDLIIPNLITKIGTSSFGNCTGFDGEIKLSSSLKTIGTSTFYGCTGLTGNLILPNSLTNIGNHAFSNCSKLVGNIVIPNTIAHIGVGAFGRCSSIDKIYIGVNCLDVDSNYKKSIVDNLPTDKEVVIDVSYNLDITNTWLETTNRTISKPIISGILNEDEVIDNKGEYVSLSINSLYKESNIVITRDGKAFSLPKKDENGQYNFTKNGVYQLKLTTDLGVISIIDFEVEELEFKIAKEAVIKAEASNDLLDINNARELVNKLPEYTKKGEFQNRLDILIPNISLEKKNTTSNLDIYIKSQNMLSMSLDTNSVTFENYSGVEDVEKLGAVNITINSSLPYTLNAYIPNKIENSDKSKEMDLDVFNIRENSSDTYSKFENHVDKVALKENCPKGNGKVHTIDIKLSNNEAHEADIYKTVIKFEVEQK